MPLFDTDIKNDEISFQIIFPEIDPNRLELNPDYAIIQDNKEN